MSHLDAFAQHLLQNPDLQDRLRQAESEDALVEQVLAEAKKLGYALDAGEIRQRLTAVHKGADLSDAELAAVSGGGKTDYCWTEYCTDGCSASVACPGPR